MGAAGFLGGDGAPGSHASCARWRGSLAPRAAQLDVPAFPAPWATSFPDGDAYDILLSVQSVLPSCLIFSRPFNHKAGGLISDGYEQRLLHANSAGFFI